LKASGQVNFQPMPYLIIKQRLLDSFASLSIRIALHAGMVISWSGKHAQKDTRGKII
jgi:hypothetical protein